MIVWVSTRTGRRLHLCTRASLTTLCDRTIHQLIGSAVPGHDSMRHNDQRPTCHDCQRVAGYVAQAAGLTTTKEDH